MNPSLQEKMNIPLNTTRAYSNKLTNKLWGVVYMSAVGKKKGDVLISYITEPFTKAPWQHLSNLHTNYWECYEIARLFSVRGYAVDIINWNDSKFIPKKEYGVCLDIQNNLERLSHFLPKDCKKVMHIVSASADFQNAAEKNRLGELKKRRGITLTLRRQVPVSKNLAYADFLEGFGNKTIQATYTHTNKYIFPIPISAVQLFDFPEDKNFHIARKHFLWFGGGGAILKGLDLVLEAFAKNPSLNLHVCGPVAVEKDFTKAYKKELYETSNIHFYGRIDVTTDAFKKLADTCGALIYPAFSEGTSGAVVQTMHAGVVPIITPETGIHEELGGIIIRNPTIDSISEAANEFSSLPAEKIRAMAHDIWSYARTHYTREAFSEAYAYFIDDILHL